jgi:hypothetical protein
VGEISDLTWESFCFEGAEEFEDAPAESVLVFHPFRDWKIHAERQLLDFSSVDVEFSLGRDPFLGWEDLHQLAQVLQITVRLLLLFLICLAFTFRVSLSTTPIDLSFLLIFLCFLFIRHHVRLILPISNHLISLRLSFLLWILRALHLFFFPQLRLSIL